MKTIINLPITVTATDVISMQCLLDVAETAARSLAMRERRRGILITRHDYGLFTIALSDSVPFGLTHEHQNW